jgi:chlorite dismutase
MKSNIQHKAQFILYIFAIFGVATVGYTGTSAFTNGWLTTTAFAQQDPFLSQRLSRIEQRFTTIESRLSQLEQQSRYSATTSDSASSRQTEIRLLRSQIDALQLRAAEIECGLIRLDERTLSNTSRQAERKSGAGKSDICRQTPNVPLQLSARP